nr:MAG TPA: hypothetical protein [Caudoviricetes sp.]
MSLVYLDELTCVHSKKSLARTPKYRFNIPNDLTTTPTAF